MVHDINQNPFPVKQTLVAITGCAIAGLCILVLVTKVLFTSSQAIHASIFSASLTSIAVILSFVPVAMVGCRGLMQTMYAYFLGMGIRFILCVMMVVIAVVICEYPILPVLVGLLIYLPLLMVEVGCIGRHLWRQDLARQSMQPKEVSG